MNTVFEILFMLALYALPVAGIAWLLRRAGLSERWAIFTGCAAIGLFMGVLAGFDLVYKESMFTFNLPGMWPGDSIYVYAINHFGNPHSAYAHFTIPWVLRTPQLYLFTSVVAWLLLGFVVQLIYNLLKKPAAARQRVAPVLLSSLLAFLCAATATIYFTQDSQERYGPTQPSAVPILQVEVAPLPGLPQPPAPRTTYNQATTYRVHSLTLSADTVQIGEPLNVGAVVTNTGPQEGMADVQLGVDGQILSSQKVALSTEETKNVMFMVTVPRSGSYQVSIGDLWEGFEVVYRVY